MVDRRPDLYSIAQITIGLIHLGVALKIQEYFADIVSKISVVVLLIASFLSIYLIIRRFREIRSYHPINYSEISNEIKYLGFNENFGIKWRIFIYSGPEIRMQSEFDRINDIEAYLYVQIVKRLLKIHLSFLGDTFGSVYGVILKWKEIDHFIRQKRM